LNDITIKFNEDEGYFYFKNKDDNVILYTISLQEFGKILSADSIDKHSKKFRDDYVSLTNDTSRDTTYFMSLVSSCNTSCVRNSIIEFNNRLQSFLIYHIKTLRSIKTRLLKGVDEATVYIDEELYNMGHIKHEELTSILDAVTKKRKGI